jgi:hypothetical protein
MVAVEVVARDQDLERDGDRLVEAAGLGWAEHGALSNADRLGNGARSPAGRAGFLNGWACREKSPGKRSRRSVVTLRWYRTGA